MKNLIALVMVEAYFSQANWWQMYQESLSEELTRRNLAVTYHYESTISQKNLPESQIAILFGTSAGWLNQALAECGRHDLRPVLVTPEPKEQIEGVSLVTPDRTGSTRHLVSYLVSCGKEHLAFFNPRPGSVNGRRREEAFRLSCEEISVNGIVFHDHNASRCVQYLIEQADQIDAVICVDDLAAVFFLSAVQQEGLSVPGQLFVASFGDSILGRYSRPPLTAVTMDMKELARQAVGCALYLYRNPRTVSLNCLVANRLIIRASTDHRPDNSASSRNRFDILEPLHDTQEELTSPELSDVSKLESCLAQADELDFAIIRCLRTKTSCKQIAQQHFVSESTVYYRIDRLCQMAGMPDRTAFMDLLTRYTHC